jgi:hypothetical protein
MYWLDSDLSQRGDLHVVRFEDLRAAPVETVGGIVDFLGLDATGSDVQRAVADHTLEKMRTKEEDAPEEVLRRHSSRERFVGEGSVGGWRSKLDPEQTARLEDAMRPALTRLGYPVGAPSA